MNVSLRFVVVGLLAAATLRADVKLAPLFGNNMVIQRNRNVPVWGTAESGEDVVIELSGAAGAPKLIARAHARTGADGAWHAALPPMKAGGPYTLRVRGRDTLTCSNVMVGEVWLCSGQSNMEFTVKKTDHADEDIRSADLPLIRLFTVKHAIAGTPQRTCTGAWSASSPARVEDFSAVAFLFAREVQPKLGCAVGLIQSTWGGTPAEAWTPNEVLANDSDFASILATWEGYYAAYPAAKAKYDAAKDSLLQRYEADAARARAEHTPLPRKPAEPRGPGHRDSPSGTFNGMIAPLAPYAIRGVLWYQGEANATRAVQYRRLFPAMITAWRRLWRQEDMPFLFVQLPNLIRLKEKDKEGWTMLREAQRATLTALPNVHMAVAIDRGDSLDIHPTNKRDIGHRLALIARARVYGEKHLEYSGPLFSRAEREGSAMRVFFTHTTGGLRTMNDEPVREFTIAGSDGIFHPAHAAIDGAQLVVRSAAVTHPVAVRYGWKDNPRCNLSNGEGLPASPFRSDAGIGAAAVRESVTEE